MVIRAENFSCLIHCADQPVWEPLGHPGMVLADGLGWEPERAPPTAPPWRWRGWQDLGVGLEMREQQQSVIPRDDGSGYCGQDLAGGAELGKNLPSAWEQAPRPPLGQASLLGLGSGAWPFLMLLGLGFTGCPGWGRDQAGNEHTAAEAEWAAECASAYCCPQYEGHGKAGKCPRQVPGDLRW